ncbi:MAG: hypothetical protein ABFR53_12920, partial [Actinomycetota bacterium]
MLWQLVIGVRGERDVRELVSPLRGQIANVYAAAPDDAAAIDAGVVATEAGDALAVEASTLDSVEEAVSAALDAAGPDGGVVVAGSLYVVGEVRDRFVSGSDRSSEAHMRFAAERFDDHDHGDLDAESDRLE